MQLNQVRVSGMIKMNLCEHVFEHINTIHTFFFLQVCSFNYSHIDTVFTEVSWYYFFLKELHLTACTLLLRTLGPAITVPSV